MKKDLLFLVGLLVIAPSIKSVADTVFTDDQSFTIAKAVKLGRGSAYSVATDAQVNTGTDTELRKGGCETNEECPSNKKCMNYQCVDVCTQPTPSPGMTMARICPGKKCIADPNVPHSFTCVDSCYQVQCKSGYTTEVTSDGCCCVPSSCPSGQRLSNGTCVANCTGVTCKSGYKTVSKTDSCCCEAEIAACSVANCSSCSGSTCSKCNSGYYLSGGKCVSCPANATCTGTSSFTCKSGYEKYNNTCRISSCNGISSTPTWCPDGYTRIEGKGCCPPGVDTTRIGACMQCRTNTTDLLQAVDCGNCNCGAGYVVVRNGLTCSCQWDGVTLPAKQAKVCY